MDIAHIKEWPDKILFAGMTLTMASFLGILFDIGRLGGITVDADWAGWLEGYPAGLSIVFNAFAMGFGVFAIKDQAWAPAVLGAVFAIASLGFLLIVPALAVVSLGFVLRGAKEGEEMTWDDYLVQAHLWPDKAIAASMLFFVGGVLAIVHGSFILADNMAPLYAVETPGIQGVISIVLGLTAITGAYQTFHLQHSTGGKVAAACCFLSAAFGFMGPVFGIIGFMLVGMAEKEEEYTPQVTA